jgi:hypothetical protein
MMQAFAYRHLVCCQDLKVGVLEGQGFRAPLRILDATPVKIPAGGTVKVRIGTPSRGFMDRFNLELNDPPEGITLQQVVTIPAGAELTFCSDPNKVKPGLAGNLIIDLLPAPGAQPPARPAAQAGPQPATQPTAQAAAQAKPAAQAQPTPKDPNQPKPQPRPQPMRKRNPAGTLPAVPFEIVAK